MRGFACGNWVHHRIRRRDRRSARGTPCMSAGIRLFESRRRWVCTPAVLVMLLLVPASASAAPPMCADGEFSVSHDRTLVLPAAPCTGGNGTLTLAPVTLPTHGQLSYTTGGVPQYTPNPRYVGPDSFTYRATDADVGGLEHRDGDDHRDQSGPDVQRHLDHDHGWQGRRHLEPVRLRRRRRRPDHDLLRRRGLRRHGRQRHDVHAGSGIRRDRPSPVSGRRRRCCSQQSGRSRSR